MPKALVIDDDKGSREGLVERLAREGLQATGVGDLAGARTLLEKHRYDIVLIDLQLPDGSGLELLEPLAEQDIAEVVFVTGHASTETAVEAFRGGAVDYLTKPVDLRRIKKLAANCLRTVAMREQVNELRGELRKLGHFGAMVGGSTVMQGVYDLVGKVAPTDATVFVTGETGTGKEVVAQTVHSMSARASKPMVPINCGAVSPSLIESELFGHEKGSFTGAERARDGIFEQADKGTLFLDEITEMPIELQVKLLRVLETGTVTRVGGNTPRAVDVRVVAACNRDPRQAVRDNKLREDLLYRLMVFPIELPPLRDRSGDIELLAGHFLNLQNEAADTAKKFSQAALDKLAAHDWPGNVRELKHVVERAYILAGDEVEPADIPLEGVHRKGSAQSPNGANAGSLNIGVGVSVAEAEQKLVLATVSHCSGDKKAAADMLGMSLKTLYNRLNRYKGPL